MGLEHVRVVVEASRAKRKPGPRRLQRNKADRQRIKREPSSKSNALNKGSPKNKTPKLPNPAAEPRRRTRQKLDRGFHPNPTTKVIPVPQTRIRSRVLYRLSLSWSEFQDGKLQNAKDLKQRFARALADIDKEDEQTVRRLKKVAKCLNAMFELQKIFNSEILIKSSTQYKYVDTAEVEIWKTLPFRHMSKKHRLNRANKFRIRQQQYSAMQGFRD